MSYLGNEIIKLRTKCSMTQEDLAEKIGVSRQVISRWETGVSKPRAENLEKLCQQFNTTSNKLFGISDDKEIIKETTNKKMIQDKTIRNIIITIVACSILLFLSYGYRFAILMNITNKVKQYQYLENYYCHIKTYENSDMIEDKEIWYKDGKYKVVTKYSEKVITEIIDIENEEYYSDMNENLQKDVKKLKPLYENGKMLYQDFPIVIKGRYLDNIKSVFSGRILELTVTENRVFIKENKNENSIDVQIDRNTGIPLYSHASIIRGETPVERFQYFDVKVDAAEDKNLEK